MSEIDALLAEIRSLPPTRPTSADDLEDLLSRMKSVAGRWADVLLEVHESAQDFAGPRTAAALEIAFRRAEESYVELEIALGDCAQRAGR